MNARFLFYLLTFLRVFLHLLAFGLCFAVRRCCVGAHEGLPIREAMRQYPILAKWLHELARIINAKGKLVLTLGVSG